jgi:hypothetical protein
MTKEGLNRFDGGMNKDLAKGLLPANKYRDATNFRVITTKGSTTGSFENIKGNKPISVDDLVDGYIIGSCELRDEIILFTTTNVTDTPEDESGISRIYKLTLDLVTEEQGDLTLLYADADNVDTSYLNFSTYYPIKAIGKYETPDVQKVYWTDGYNSLRYANVASNLTNTGEAYSVSGDYMSADKFDFLPKFSASKPILKNIVGGKVSTGIIAYAYQLYIINGAETAISPLSDPIHVVLDNDFKTNSSTYKGVAVKTNSGKGFALEIDNTDNVGFNRLRLIRVAYEFINSTPTITICNEIEIDPSGSVITVTDTGDDLGILTVDQFNIDSTELFKCQDIAVKDGKLFAANIDKEDFIVDEWDARAVRFKSGSTATVYNDDDTSVAIAANLSNWSSYTVDHDGINKFNDPDNDGDSAYAWKYQADGTTLGAEGPNIKIGLRTEEVVIDSSNDNTTFNTTPPTDTNDLSYKSYASPWKDGKLSWQRDETYRLFVVFGNDRNQLSFPKWICDLRMPSLHDDDFIVGGVTYTPSGLANVDAETGVVSTNRLYPIVYFKSFPENASFARIYRVKRERSDRSVVTQGLVIPTYYTEGVNYMSKADVAMPHPIGYGLIKMVSPEINITKNISLQGNDYLEYVTTFEDHFATTEEIQNETYHIGYVHKLLGNTKVAYSSYSRADIVEAYPIAPSPSETTLSTINTAEYTNYGSAAKGCTGLLLSYDNGSWTAETEKYVLVNYKSNTFGSQYGGNTYEDRTHNICLPCSDVINKGDIAGTNSWFDVSYGDTFIDYFDVSTLLFDLSKNYMNTYSETVYVPLESSINCELRSDTSQRHMWFENSPMNGMMRQEYAGTHIDSGSHRYTQAENLYSYNTVYSQQLDLQAGICLSADKQLETEFDSMVRCSDTKFNGEITDSWTKFPINEFIEVDSIYGPVNSIVNFNNKLFYLQDKAFGVLSINERSLIQDNNTAKLVLGTGGILDRYDYITLLCGTKDKFSVVMGDTGLFWYDRINNYIIKYADNIDKISISKGIQSYLTTEVLTTQSVIAVADRNDNEIIFTFFEDANQNGDSSFTIAWSENMDAFISFYTFTPTIFIPYRNRYLTTTLSKYSGADVNLDYIFLQDSDIYPRCNFYALTDNDAAKFYDSTVETLFNSDYEYTKTWDNLFYISNVYDSSGIELYDQTIDTIRCYNDYQNTGYIDLTYADNLRRRERIWTLGVPRNAVVGQFTANSDILNVANLDTTRTFRERLRDKYMTLNLVFNNNATRDKFVLDSVGTRYRFSYR